MPVRTKRNSSVFLGAEKMDNRKNSIWDRKLLWVIISLFASVLLWVYVTTSRGDIIEVRIENIHIVFIGEDTIREKEGLIVTELSNETISVNIKGTRRDISRLSANNIIASVDISKIATVGQHTSSLDITFPSIVDNSTMSVVSTTPSTITFSIAKENSKIIEVIGEFAGTVAEGFVAKEPVIEPSTVMISGSDSDLRKVSYAKVLIQRDEVDKTLIFDSEYILCDAEGNEIDKADIYLGTEIVRITLPISATKEVPLTVDLVEGSGATIENVKINCNPESIIIAGDAEILDGINKISLGTVDLSSFAFTFEESFKIVLDNNITNVTGQSEAKVTIEIIGLETKMFYITNISCINVAEGSKVSIITEYLPVTLRGSEDVLTQIQANNIRAVADLSEITETKGEFQPSVKIYVDGYTGVGPVNENNGEYKIYIRIE